MTQNLTSTDDSSALIPNASWDLTGQVALVTGATSGLGRRFAEVLAAAGASVVLTGRRTERLAEVADVIRGRGGVCLPVTTDVTDSDQLIAAVAAGEEALARSRF
jgi:NADP-dependent 3-hydroxy acid dehydrogenase YdfG